MSKDKEIKAPKPPKEDGWEGERKKLRLCSRCGLEWCELGKVLEWGKHYDGYKVKLASGETKEYPPDDEVKKALCVRCAKEHFDEAELAQQREEIVEMAEDVSLELTYKYYPDDTKDWSARHRALALVGEALAQIKAKYLPQERS